MKIVGIDPVTLAYIAGIIDGEGWIGARRRLPSDSNRMTAPRYSIGVSVEMTDREAVDLIAEMVGKRVSCRARPPHKPIYGIAFEHGIALEFLRCVRPYLRVKAHQADLAIELGQLRLTAAAHRTKVLGTHIFQAGRAAGHDYRVLGLSDDYVKCCDDLYQALQIRPVDSPQRAFCR